MSLHTRSFYRCLESLRREAVQTYGFTMPQVVALLRSLRAEHGPEGARELIRSHYWRDYVSA
jgi:hypothetical protein